MKWISEFIDDYLNLSIEELDNKYSGKIPRGITIAAIIETARNEHKINNFIEEIWFGDKRDKKNPLLLKNTHGKFEVFVSERGGQHWLTTHDNLESAIFDKLDLLLTELSFAASDSIINAIR